jgi:hypothetical protein
MSYKGPRGGGIVRRYPAMCSRGQAYLLAEFTYVSESRSTRYPPRRSEHIAIQRMPMDSDGLPGVE